MREGEKGICDRATCKANEGKNKSLIQINETLFSDFFTEITF